MCLDNFQQGFQTFSGVKKKKKKEIIISDKKAITKKQK